MQQVVLVINLGSASLKFSIFAIEQDEVNTTAIIRGQLAPLELNTQLILYDKNGHATQENIRLANKENNNIQVLIFKFLLNWLDTNYPNYTIAAAGHRVVHGGNLFSCPVVVNVEVFTKLQTLCSLAPLHQPYNLSGIQILAQQLPNIKQVACFDTAFHSTQSDLVRAYAIPESVSQGLIKRYGFHGLSYEYIAQVLPNYLDTQIADGKIIVAHLGHGASLCAMHKRKSIATTMGFTALDGLPMGTRCGSIDPGIILYLMTERKMTVTEVTELLYNKSGLLGVSGISSDIRELINSNDPNAKFAIDLFTYRIAREIGSLMAALGGLDGIVFTAGIGEHSSRIRAEVCKQLIWLGIDLNLTANTANEIKISTAESAIPITVIPTNEELIIAQHTWHCIYASQN